MALLAHVDEEVDLLDQLEQEIQSQGWSGSRETYANGNADVEIVPGENGSVSFALLANRGAEVQCKRLSPEEKREFDISDASEWKAISKGTKAVIVHPPKEASELRRLFPGRIVSSRMVRGWKPQEGTFSKEKAKSRWCVRGHQDEYATELQVHAPAPCMGALALFLVTSLMYRLTIYT
eukprot:379740-Pyramimonas_sp.AAC.1